MSGAIFRPQMSVDGIAARTACHEPHTCWRNWTAENRVSSPHVSALQHRFTGFHISMVISLPMRGCLCQAADTKQQIE